MDGSLAGRAAWLEDRDHTVVVYDVRAAEVAGRLLVDSLTVARLGRGTVGTFVVAEGRGIDELAGWESETALLLTMDGAVVRCDVVEESCEYAGEPARR